jgi:hypothetical protein
VLASIREAFVRTSATVDATTASFFSVLVCLRLGVPPDDQFIQISMHFLPHQPRRCGRGTYIPESASFQGLGSPK